MRAVLPNDNMNIKDGMFVKVNLLADTVKNAIAIPESSIGSDQAGRFVYLVDDSNRVAKFTYITSSLYIVDSGLGDPAAFT